MQVTSLKEVEINSTFGISARVNVDKGEANSLNEDVSMGLLLLQAFVAEGAVLTYAFAWQGLVAPWIGGLTLAWLAASLPAYKAAGVPPVAALRQVT